MNYMIKSKPVSIRIDPGTEDKIAFIQTLSTRGGKKPPSVTAITRFAIDHLVWNIDDMLEQPDVNPLQAVISGIDRAHQPKGSAFSHTPSFASTAPKPFRDMELEAVKNRFNSAFDRLGNFDA